MRSHCIIIVVLFFFINCKKNRSGDSELYFGTVTASKNGETWNASIYGAAFKHHSKFSIGIHKFGAPGLLTEALTIHNLPKKTGTYRVLRFKYFHDTTNIYAGFWTTRDGDTPCDDYDVVEEDSASNFVKIESFNAVTKEFSGRFSVKLLIQLPKCRQNAPDTLTFRNGYFQSKLMY